MQAIRLHGVRDIRVDSLPEPGEPGPGQVMVRVRAVGICGSDIHYYQDMRIGDQAVEPPMTLGHEFSGVIAAVGEGVADLPLGRRVAVEPGVPCGVCEPCRTGRPNVCQAVEFAGAAPRQGAGCDYWLHPAEWIFPLPDAVSDAEGAMIEPFGVALHAAKLAGIEPGQTASVHGAGTIGLCLLAALKALGAGKVYVSEPIAARREIALRMGATEVIDPAAEGSAGRIREMTGGRGVDIAFEAAGAPDAINDGIATAMACGKLCVVGICREDAVPLHLHDARRRELTVFHSRRSAHVNDLAIDLMASGRADLKPIITHVFPIGDAPDAYRLADGRADGVVKTMIELGE